jgi:SAM-dependent methyltransferase
MNVPIVTNLRKKLPLAQRQRLRRLAQPAWLGTMRRVTPLSTEWGYERGTPVDRYYIEHFLTEHRQAIHGRVLEIKDSSYTQKYGMNVQQSDVLDIDPTNPQATLVADLAAADAIPADSFDCFILTQTLQLIYNMQAAITHAHRILRPGGVLLVTVPVISRIIPRYGLEHDYWRFTNASCQRLFGDLFGAEQVMVQPYGNVLAAIAFLSGIAQEELSQKELETHDPYFPILMGVRATKKCE